MTLPPGPRLARLGLAALFGVAGTLHLAVPTVFEALVPGWVGPAQAIVYVSGGAELMAAGLLARVQTAAVGGWYSVVLLLAVWPGNITMAWHGGILAWLRVPLQLPLMWLALVARRAVS